MTETPILAKFPEDIAQKIREGLVNFALPPMGITKSGPSEVTVDFDDTILKGKAMQLPCVTEVLKTFNKEIYYKCGDISTMFDFSQPENQTDERMKLKELQEKGISRTVEKKVMSGEDEQTSAQEMRKRLLEERKRTRSGVELKAVPMDNGLTPPATSIRTEWLQRTPVCECPNQDDYICKKCGYFPKHKVTEVGEWLFSCLHEKPSEKFEIIEVNLDEWDEPGDNDTERFQSRSQSVDSRARNNQTAPRSRVSSAQRPTVGQRQSAQFLRKNIVPSYPFVVQNACGVQRPTMPFSMSRPSGHQGLNSRLGSPRMPSGSAVRIPNKENPARQFLK